ncbi:MAG: redoxin domain-containing protein [Bacteroidota bacterium]
MRQFIKISIICIVLATLFYLCYNIILKSKEKTAIARQLQTIPKFEFLTLEENPFSNNNLIPELHTIFIYFDSQCEFCQHEAQSISDHLNRLQAIQFVFVSEEPINAIRQFSEEYNLSNQPNITFLHDNSRLFSSQFGATSIPYILIYDKNKVLIKRHNGQLNANGILKTLSNNE